MTLPLPTPDALAALAARLGLGIDATDLETYYGASVGLLGSWETVDRLYAAQAPVPPARAWHQPADNPLGAWYVTTDIPGAAGRPAGRQDRRGEGQHRRRRRADDERLGHPGRLRAVE